MNDKAFTGLIARNSVDLLSLLLVVLFALLLRIHHLDYESLFMDELHQVSYYPASLFDMPAMAAHQQQPPLDYWIGHIMIGIANSDFFVRLPAMLFGVGSTAILYLLLTRLTGRATALVTSLIFSATPFQLYFSQHARPYSIAIFFFLAVLYSLFWCLRSDRCGWNKLAVLFLCVYGFLLSRTLSPLSTVTAITLLLGSAVVYFTFVKQGDVSFRNRLFAIAVTMVAAVLAFLPFLHITLDAAARYTGGSTQVGFATLLNGLRNFSLLPMLKAYLVQLEPVSYWILPFLLIAPVLISRAQSQRLFKVFLLLLLPCVCMIDLFVFQSRTDFPFRPPYAIYLAPLCLMLAAIGHHELTAACTKGQRGRRLVAVLNTGLTVILVLVTASALLDFKTLRRNSDWRGVCEYLQTQFGTGHYYLFDSLNPYGTWEPVFYGFPRYHPRPYNGLALDAVPLNIGLLDQDAGDPVLIMFYYRDYFLTRHSRYPFIPVPGTDGYYDFAKLEHDPALDIRKFTGFYIVTLKDDATTGARRLLHLVERVLADFPASSALIDWHLAAAALGKSLNMPDWNDDLVMARQLTPPEYEEAVSAAIGRIAGN